MKRNLLLTPGPTQIPADLCAALGRPIIHHRTPQFQQNLKDVIAGLQYILQTKNDIYLLASSGTGGMEACVCNLLSPGDKAITVESGKFGERWTELCKAYGADPYAISVEWGKTVQPDDIEKALTRNKEVKAVYITLNETSTAVVADVKAIAEIVSQTDAVLVVDAISGLGVMDLQMDSWKVDVVVSASHKGFMLSPGLTFVAMNPKAMTLMDQSTSPRYYFDLRKSKKLFEKPDTPYTPAIGIVVAMVESLKKMEDVGREELFAKYARLAKGIQAAAGALGMDLLAEETCRSTALTAIKVPEGVDGGKIVAMMRDNHGISIAGGQAHLKGKIIRMAHMGCVDEYDILTGISCLEKVLKELGYAFEMGAGVAAAQKVFNQ